MNDTGDFWVFGYGSLMWRPGFDFVERRIANVHGYHRSLCIFSHVHRGTPEHPGLVLGLDRGGSCKGVAFRVSAANRAATIAYLRERELVTAVYEEKWIRIDLGDGRSRVSALCYVVDRGHKQYAGKLGREHSLRLVRQGVGQSGANPEYVLNTYAHLVEIGLDDAELAWFCRHLT
jgi:cation transport protein ChaC